MARMTKSQQALHDELEAEVSFQAFVREYPARFAKVLFSFATVDNSQLNVKQVDATHFVFSTENAWETRTLAVASPANQSWDAVEDLEHVERLLKQYDDERAEEQRKYEVRNAALAKLNAEERELLNLR